MNDDFYDDKQEPEDKNFYHPDSTEDKDFDKEPDIYAGDESAIAAVSSLFDSQEIEILRSTDPPVRERAEARSERQERAERRAPVREYKVREYASDRDDFSAEDEIPYESPFEAPYEPPAEDFDEAPGEAVRRESSRETARETSRETRKRKETYSPEDEDYDDYIRTVARDNAEDRKKRGKTGFGGGRDDFKDVSRIRDASQNPALRKKDRTPEQEKDVEQDVRPPEDRLPPQNPVRTNSDRRGGAYQGTDRTAKPRRPAPKYPTPPVTAAKQDPMRGEPRPGAFTGGTGVGSGLYEQNRRDEKRRSNSGGSGGGADALSIFTDMRIILGLVAFVFLVLAVWLFIQNAGLRRDAHAVETSEAELHQATMELTTANITITELRGDLNFANDRINELNAILDNMGYGQGGHDGGDSGFAQGGDRPENPQPTPTPDLTIQTHTVASGETLSRIGTHWGVRWQDIAEFNGITDPGRIRPGDVLRIPPRQ